MADVKDQVVQETTEITETQTTHEQPKSSNEPFRFTQDELDEVVAKRLVREREAFAKKLGIEKYDAIDSFLENYQTTISEKEDLSSKYQFIVETAFDKEIRLNALMSGVNPEHLDRVVKLALAEMDNLGEEDEVDVSKTMSNILNEFPMFKSSEPEATIRKIGQQPSKEASSKTDMDRYLDKYKESKYFNK